MLPGLLAGVLVLAGCGGSDSGSDSGSNGDDSATSECTYDWSEYGITVSGTGGDAAVIEVAEDADPPAELVSVDLCVGDGATVPPGAAVTVDYIGVSTGTKRVFDSSFSRGVPATFGLNQVIDGWSEGLVGMNEGGTRLLVIPPDMAYGEVSTSPDILPNDTLIFVVDLIDVAE